MARRPSRKSLEAQLRELLGKYKPEIQKAFLESIADLRDDVAVTQLIAALKAQNIEAALGAVGLDRAAFRGVENAIAAAFEAGGVAGAGGFPVTKDAVGGVIKVRFDTRDLISERVLKEQSSKFVTEVTEDTRKMLRDMISRRLSEGQGPIAIARDIAGRVSTATGRRTGGILGLTSGQEKQAETVRQMLKDPTAIRQYFIKDESTGAWKPRYKTTPRSFDKQVLKAINEGKALDTKVVESVTTKHYNNLLLLRGETVARTEVLGSVNAGRREAFRQGLAKTQYTEDNVERVWDSAGDAKVRATHRAMDGETVSGLTATYSNGLLHPGDPNGAPEEVINCRCVERIRIKYFKDRN